MTAAARVPPTPCTCLTLGLAGDAAAHRSPGYPGAGRARGPLAAGADQPDPGGRGRPHLLHAVLGLPHGHAAAGHLPLWNPYLFLGVPFLANPQAAVLYPLHWPSGWLPPDQALVWSALLHVWLAAGFTYVFAGAR